MSFYLQVQGAPSMPDEVHVDFSGPLPEELASVLAKFVKFAELKKIDEARSEGFADCEKLIAQWLESKAAIEERGESDSKVMLTLRSAALAIRLGQYRREVEP